VPFEQMIAAQTEMFLRQLETPGQWVALIAAAAAAVLIIVSAFVKTIIPLRWLAVGGNLGFIVYGLLHPAPLVAALHAALFPINLWRVLEILRLTRRVRRADAGGAALQLWLQPFMKRLRVSSGRVLFRKGDTADRLYVVAEGRLELVESGRTIEAGQMFGEIAFFAPDRQRSATARALEPSTLLWIDETTFRQLFYQNPSFGFEVVRLVAGRLLHEVGRLEQQLHEHSPEGAALSDTRRASARAHSGSRAAGSWPTTAGPGLDRDAI
jgi:CRP-like cAMP-binding protein